MIQIITFILLLIILNLLLEIESINKNQYMFIILFIIGCMGEYQSIDEIKILTGFILTGLLLMILNIIFKEWNLPIKKQYVFIILLIIGCMIGYY